MEAALSVRLANIERMLATLVEQVPQQSYYSVADVAKIVDRSPYQVREWCKAGRLRAEKRESGRGLSKEWMVSREELELYKSMGLRACKK